jgi:hypothetical protein
MKKFRRREDRLTWALTNLESGEIRHFLKRFEETGEIPETHGPPLSPFNYVRQRALTSFARRIGRELKTKS